MSTNPFVNLEVSLEYEVDEILPNGVEKLIQPYTFSDEIADANLRLLTTEETEDNLSVKKLEGIKNSLKLALQEVTVLGDVLNMTHPEDKFLSLEPINSDKLGANGFDFDFLSRKYVVLVLRQALEKAYNILVEAHNRLLGHNNDVRNEANREIIKLRLNFAVKRFKDEVYGDLDICGDNVLKFSKNTCFRVDTCGEGHLRVSLPHALKYDLFVKLSAENNSLVLDFKSFPMVEEIDPFHTLNRAQNSLFFQRLFKTVGREIKNTQGKDRISLPLDENDLNSQASDSFLFKTLEYVLSFQFAQVMSSPTNHHLFYKTTIYLKNCLQRYRLLKYIKNKQFSDDLRVFEVTDSFASLHCIRIQLIMILKNVPRQFITSVEIRDGTTTFITGGGRIFKNCNLDQMGNVIEAQAVNYKFGVLEMVANKFGFSQRSHEVDSVDNEGDQVFVFTKDSKRVVFVLNSLINLRVFSQDGTEIEGSGLYIDRLEAVFCSLN